MRCGIGKPARLVFLGGALGIMLSLGQSASAQIDLNRFLFREDRSANGAEMSGPRQAVYYDNGNYQSAPANYQTGTPYQDNDQSGPPSRYQPNVPGNRRPRYRTASSDSARPQMPGQNRGSNSAPHSGYAAPQNGYGPHRAARPAVAQDEILMADGSADDIPVDRPIRSVMPGASEVVHPSPTAVFIEGNKVLVGQLNGGETVMPGRPTMQKSPPTRYRSMVPDGSMMQGGPTTQAGPVTWGPIQYENSMGGGGPMIDGPMMGGPPTMGCGCDGYTNPYCNDCSCCGSGPGCGGGCGNDCGAGCCGGSGGGCFGGNSCGGGSCGNQCSPYGRPWLLAPIDWLFGMGPYRDCNSCDDWSCGQELTVFVGTHNFKNPSDLLSRSGPLNSNFGFQEGLNYGMPLLRSWGVSAQFGFELLQSDFNTDSRHQFFLSTGLFHRPDCCQGLQGGLVFDWLHDDVLNSFDVAQLRGEVSWLCDCHNEGGFLFATGVLHDTLAEAINQFEFFYRRRFCAGGDIRFLGGFYYDGGRAGEVLGRNGGLFGLDYEVPISKSWSVNGGFNYLIPASDRQNAAFAQESWNLGFNIVWHMGCNARCNCDPYRPLFGVADNGSLMTTAR